MDIVHLQAHEVMKKYLVLACKPCKAESGYGRNTVGQGLPELRPV